MKQKLINIMMIGLVTIALGTSICVNAQNRRPAASDRQIETLLVNIETKTDTYKRAMEAALDRTMINSTAAEDRISNFIADFEAATDALRSGFNSRRDVNREVSEVLNRAMFINRFMSRNRMNNRTQSQWTSLRADLNTLASYYRVSWNWNQQVPTTNPAFPAYTATDIQMRSLVTRIENRTDTFKRQLSNALDRTRFNNTNREDNVNDYVTEFENATDRLKQKFDARESVGADATEVLSRAQYIDRFMTNNRLTNAAQTQWRNLKTELNTLAGYYRLSWNWNQTIPTPDPSYPSYTATDIQLRSLLTRIENKTDVFKRQMDSALDQTRWNNTNREDNVNDFITEFENATDRLKQKFDNRDSTGSDASEVLTRAQFIDRFMTNNRLTNVTQSQWRNLKTDLDTLASYYRVSWNWNQTIPTFPGTGNNSGFDARITGTYRLNTSLSDDVHAVIDRSLPHDATEQHDGVTRNLQRRLNSPEMIAIDKRNRTVILASTNGQQITFEADGVGKTETNARGRTITTTATADRDGINISYVGERSNDFYVTFAPLGSGQMKVTRRIYLENQNDQITVSSVYDKVNNTAQWSTVNSGTVNDTGAGNVNTFYIPNGVRLTAVLNNAVDTKVSQVGDRFTMEVTSPSQYRGAVIEGHIGSVGSSGRVSGRANISMEFDTIRLANGSSYRFAGLIDSVKAANGDEVSVNNEGTVRDSNQTTKTVTRAGIGAILGAIIGAVAGGGQGAAIGAGVGAGVGAGSVLVTGRDSILLSQGSEFTITASAPGTVVGTNR